MGYSRRIIPCKGRRTLRALGLRSVGPLPVEKRVSPTKEMVWISKLHIKEGSIINKSIIMMGPLIFNFPSIILFVLKRINLRFTNIDYWW